GLSVRTESRRARRAQASAVREPVVVHEEQLRARVCALPVARAQVLVDPHPHRWKCADSTLIFVGPNVPPVGPTARWVRDLDRCRLATLDRPTVFVVGTGPR